jgi:ribosome-associated protein
MQEFILKTDYIELNKLLKLLNWVESGGQAGSFIAEGLVKVNGETETRKRCKLRKDDIVELNSQKVTLI